MRNIQFIFCFLTLTRFRCTAGMWGSHNLFENCDLHFIVTQDRFLNQTEDVPSYFDIIRTQHPFSPILWSIAIYNDREIENIGHLVLGERWYYKDFKKASPFVHRDRAVFVNLNLKVILTGTMNYFFLFAILRLINPATVFSLVKDVIDPEYYTNFKPFYGESNLIFVTLDNPNRFYIPCIPCNSILPVGYDLDRTVSLQSINFLWDKSNSDMKGQIFLNLGVPLILSRASTSESCPINIKRFNSANYACLLSVLLVKSITLPYLITNKGHIGIRQ